MLEECARRPVGGNNPQILCAKALVNASDIASPKTSVTSRPGIILPGRN